MLGSIQGMSDKCLRPRTKYEAVCWDPYRECQISAFDHVQNKLIYGCIPVYYYNLCIFIVMTMYSYCMFMYLHRASWHSSATLTEVFRGFFSIVRQMTVYNSQRRGTARALPIFFVLFYILFVLCRSVYCLCVNVYCTTATGWQPNCSLTNIAYKIVNCILQRLLWIFESYQWFSVRFAKHMGHAKYSFCTCQIAAMSLQL